jgi:hypothetical protein
VAVTSDLLRGISPVLSAVGPNPLNLSQADEIDVAAGVAAVSHLSSAIEPT